jgi:hypothetical protein
VVDLESSKPCKHGFERKISASNECIVGILGPEMPLEWDGGLTDWKGASRIDEGRYLIETQSKLRAGKDNTIIRRSQTLSALPSHVAQCLVPGNHWR